MNLRLTLPAIQLLYIYRCRYTENSPVDLVLMNELSKLSGPSLHFHSSLYERNFVTLSKALNGWNPKRESHLQKILQLMMNLVSDVKQIFFRLKNNPDIGWRRPCMTGNSPRLKPKQTRRYWHTRCVAILIS